MFFASVFMVSTSVADPGSGAFFRPLDPESGIRDGLKIKIRIWDPGISRIIFSRA
jgi:hypothetical protein